MNPRRTVFKLSLEYKLPMLDLYRSFLIKFCLPENNFKLTQRTIKIFYSWQSDLDRNCNHKAILDAIRKSIPDLEDIFTETRITVEEATSNTTGSIHIPSEIFRKILVADVFICDITTINRECGARKTPNPNVLIELGYAIATVGWERIVLVFNKSFGDFPQDVPFDIDRHRIINYELADKAEKGAKISLQSVVKKAIEEIITRNPQRPSAHNEIDKKKEQDKETLKRLLSNIHFPTFNTFLDIAPRQINTDVIHYWHGFDGIFQQVQFYLYDSVASDLIKKIHEAWHASLSKDQYYRDGAADKIQIFGSSKKFWAQPETKEDTLKQQQAWDELEMKEKKELELLTRHVSDLRKYFTELITYIKENYVDIDLNETSRIAYEDFLNYHEL